MVGLLWMGTDVVHVDTDLSLVLGKVMTRSSMNTKSDPESEKGGIVGTGERKRENGLVSVCCIQRHSNKQSADASAKWQCKHMHILHSVVGTQQCTFNCRLISSSQADIESVVQLCHNVLHYKNSVR